MRSRLNIKQVVIVAAIICFPLLGAARNSEVLSQLHVEKLQIQSEIERVDNWTERKVFDGIKIEYKFQDIHEGSLRRQTVIFFKFTNTTSVAKVFSWNLELWFDNICKNCDKMDSPEYYHELTLQPGESIEGTPETVDQALYVFAAWHEMIPGMKDIKLTKFKFVNMKTSPAK